MRTITFCLLLGVIFSCSENRAHSEDMLEGEIYSYKEEHGVTRKIEVYFPKSHEATHDSVPGIIMFHGGGWGGGKRDQFRYLCHYFASRGLVAATVSYRLATKADAGDGSRKRVCVTDAKSAIRWYKQHAVELGIDPQRIIAGGGSAGGHICLLATTNPGLNDPNDNRTYDTSVAACISVLTFRQLSYFSGVRMTNGWRAGILRMRKCSHLIFVLLRFGLQRVKSTPSLTSSPGKT